MLDEETQALNSTLNTATPNNLPDQIKGLIQLTRWREHVTFVIPLTILGALLAIQNSGAALDWRLIAVTLANILAVAYAFMINDIEDAPDDARDPARAIRNPIASGRIPMRMGYAAGALVVLASFLLYLPGGTTVTLIGVATLILSHLYSWKPVRLKAYPVTDVVSHSLMLSGLLMVAGYYIYHNDPGLVWLVVAAVTLFSVYGQLYNQLRDYAMDKAAGLHNTAIILGEGVTRWVIYGVIGLALICMLAAIFQGVFPLWLGVALIVSIGVSLLFNSNTDMRGSEFVDAGAKMQVRALIAVNLTMIIWLVAVLAQQWQII